jgi:hypothetical protein
MKDKYYKYYNPNPEGHEDACDCVIRALCAATGLSWYEVYDKCCEIGKEYGVMPNASGKKYSGIRAEAFGLEPRVIPAPKKGERSMTVRKFCERFNPFHFYLCAKKKRKHDRIYKAASDAQRRDATQKRQ